MSWSGWTLDLDAEAAILLPYLVNEPDILVRRTVEAFIGQLIADPVTRGRPDELGVRAASVGRTGVMVVWVLEPERQAIVLASIERLPEAR